MLAHVYKQCAPNIEIIWLSLDKEEADFDEYYQTMPSWLAIPFGSLTARKQVCYLISFMSSLTICFRLEMPWVFEVFLHYSSLMNEEIY